jgi:uncharacterized protein YcbX
VSPRVCGLAVTAVKGTRLRPVDQVEIGPAGVDGDRGFYVIDDRARMVNGKHFGELSTVVAAVDEDRLTLAFPDGSVVEAPVADGGPVRTRFYSFMREDRLVDGPWAHALSAHVGQPLRLVQASPGGSAVDRGAQGGVSLISRGSLTRLAREANVAGVDVRRFRMTVEIDGVGAHEEDAWVGRRALIGSVLLRFRGHIGRCLVTSRDPDTGVVDLPTLDILGGYRSDMNTTEPLPFGIHGEVLEPGRVALGDAVALVD